MYLLSTAVSRKGVLKGVVLLAVRSDLLIENFVGFFTQLSKLDVNIRCSLLCSHLCFDYIALYNVTHWFIIHFCILGLERSFPLVFDSSRLSFFNMFVELYVGAWFVGCQVILSGFGVEVDDDIAFRWGDILFSLLIDFHVRSVVNLASFAAGGRRTRRTQSNTLKVLHAIVFNEIIKTFIWAHISFSL